MSIIEKIEKFSALLKLSNILALIIVISSIISIFSGLTISLYIIISTNNLIEAIPLHLLTESIALIILGTAGIITFLRERNV